jgi:ribosomal protein S17
VIVSIWEDKFVSIARAEKMKQMVGSVVSSKMQKSVVMAVDSSRPLSKHEHWLVVEILKKARIYVPPSAPIGYFYIMI